MVYMFIYLYMFMYLSMYMSAFIVMDMSNVKYMFMYVVCPDDFRKA
jgi:hypothetical protein